MGRRKFRSTLPPDWHEHRHATVNGRHLEPGTEAKIKGERGRFRFVKRVVRDSGVEWLDFWGGPKKCESLRSFYPDRVQRVHRLKRTDKGLLDDRQEAST